LSDYEVIKNPDNDLWSSFLSNFTEGNFRHSYECGEIDKKTFSSLKVVRLAIVKKREFNEYLGIIQGEYSSYFGFGMTLIVMMGPLVNGKKDNSLTLFKHLIRELENYCRENKVIRIQIRVPVNWDMDKVMDDLEYTEVTNLSNYVVDFRNGIDYLWNNISHNKRRNIRKAIKEEVEIYESHDFEDLKKFYSMLEAARDRGGFSIYPYCWYDACWELYPEELSRVFLARWRDEIVSGVFTVIHGNTIYGIGAGSYKEGWKVRSNDIMHWKVMEWASEKGYTKYHLGLIPEPLPIKGSNTWGIWRWKREWKGNLEKMHVYEKVVLPRYKFISGIKELVQSGYNHLRQFI